MNKRVVFDVDSDVLKLISALQKFYQFGTRNKLFPNLILLAITDVASLPEDSNWSTKQRKAWQVCKAATNELQQAVMLIAAKKVLNKKPPDTTMSVHDLAVESISEFMPKETLIVYAESKGINCAGLRKSGIIGKLKKC